jgi:hypothetical protein
MSLINVHGSWFMVHSRMNYELATKNAQQYSPNSLLLSWRCSS